LDASVIWTGVDKGKRGMIGYAARGGTGSGAITSTTIQEHAMGEVEVGRVTHYYGKVGVALIEIRAGELRVGDDIRIKGKTTDLSQKIESMEIDRKPVQSAGAGQLVGIKVRERVREDDHVYREVPDR
jgi:putative protease